MANGVNYIAFCATCGKHDGGKCFLGDIYQDAHNIWRHKTCNQRVRFRSKHTGKSYASNFDAINMGQDIIRAIGEEPIDLLRKR